MEVSLDDRGGDMRSPMSNLLGFLDLRKEMLTIPRFIWLFALKLASLSSCIRGTRVEVVGPLRIFFPSMLT
jgi:hypothetical protein